MAIKGYSEDNVQEFCIKSFNTSPKYKKYRGILFAVPNGGIRHASTARRLKAQGVVAGVSDLILLTPRGGYGALCIEMKRPQIRDYQNRLIQSKGTQSKSQITWQRIAEIHKNKYVICHSWKEMEKAIDEYLAL